MLTLLKPFIAIVLSAGSVALGAVYTSGTNAADLVDVLVSTSVERQLQEEDEVKISALSFDIDAAVLRELHRRENSAPTSTSSTTSTTSTTAVPTREQLLQAYSNRQEILEPGELRELLELVGFQGDALRSAWAIAMRESRGKPLAFNGNLDTGDSSYGLFQINMIGYLGRHRAELYGLDEYDELFDPVTNAVIAYQMSSEGTNFGPWCVGPSGYNGCRVGDYPYWLTQFPEEVSNTWVTTTSVTPNSRPTR